MEYDYRLEALVDTFKEHAKEYDRNRKDLAEIFLHSHPGTELPHHLVEGFNVSRALHLICEEIVKLKGQLIGHMNEHPFS